MATQQLNIRQSKTTFSASEQMTGDIWIDTKPIYVQTFSITTAGNTTEQIFNIGLSNSTTRIIKIEGGSQTSNNDYYPIEYMNPAATTLQNMQFKLSYVSGTGWQVRCNTGAVATLIVTIYFTK